MRGEFASEVAKMRSRLPPSQRISLQLTSVDAVERSNSIKDVKVGCHLSAY